MKPKKYAYIGIAAAAGIAVVMIIFTQFNMGPTTQSASTGIDAYTLDFTYETVNSDLKNTLDTQNINMSKPLRFNTVDDITQYCDFLSNKTKQAMIQYCTSTEIRDEHANFLGNLDMIGSNLAPVLVIAAAQSDPLFHNYDDVKTLFGDVVNETVCQCWATEKPGNYTSLSGMMDALRTFHLNGKEPNSTTRSIPLSGKLFEIELTTTTQGYTWKLLVAK
ncbi:MAG: hypothetical protein ACREBB_01385 [Nitrosotalea sp.]